VSQAAQLCRVDTHVLPGLLLLVFLSTAVARKQGPRVVHVDEMPSCDDAHQTQPSKDLSAALPKYPSTARAGPEDRGCRRHSSHPYWTPTLGKDSASGCAPYPNHTFRRRLPRLGRSAAGIDQERAPQLSSRISQLDTRQAAQSWRRNTRTRSSRALLASPRQPYEYFWLDTFCIPQAPEHADLRNRAIGSMNLIYAAAAQTVVIDSALQELDAGRRPASMIHGGKPTFSAPADENLLDVTASICASNWMGRAW
jgi:hypothetical protein